MKQSFFKLLRNKNFLTSLIVFIAFLVWIWHLGFKSLALILVTIIFIVIIYNLVKTGYSQQQS